jgi:hypothetical protein
MDAKVFSALEGIDGVCNWLKCHLWPEVYITLAIFKILPYLVSNMDVDLEISSPATQSSAEVMHSCVYAIPRESNGLLDQ